MTKISELADKIRSEREASDNEIQTKFQLEVESNLRRLKDQFEIGFQDYLPLLKEANIKYSLHYNNDRYDYMGSYVLFEKDEKQLMMDFKDSKSYRYEYNGYSYNEIYTARSCYGEWRKEDFLLFIDENLLK